MGLFNKLLVLAVLSGLLYPGPGVAIKDYVSAVLALAMFFSLVTFKKDFKIRAGEVRKGIVYGYLVIGIALLAAAALSPPGIREGIALYALFPPAVSVTVLSSQWGGKPQEVFVFSMLSYVASLLFVPAAAYLLIGGAVNPEAMVIQLALIFAAPAVLSRFVRIGERHARLAKDASAFFLALVFYMVMAKSQAWIFWNWQSVVAYAAGLALLSGGVGYATYLHTKDPDAVLYSMFKNGGAAAAASMAMLPEAATAIISAKTVVDALLTVLFGKLWNR